PYVAPPPAHGAAAAAHEAAPRRGEGVEPLPSPAPATHTPLRTRSGSRENQRNQARPSRRNRPAGHSPRTGSGSTGNRRNQGGRIRRSPRSTRAAASAP